MADIYSDRDRVESALNLLEESDLSESNRYYLEEFANYLMAENLSDHKIYRYLQSFRALAPLIDFDLKDASRSDLVKLVGRINHNKIPDKDYKPSSRAELKKAIRKFYVFESGEESPDKTGFISVSVKKSNRSRVDPDRLPTPNTVKRMKNHAKNPRDKVLVSMLWESGARIGEFLSLDWDDLDFFDDHINLSLNGKTGERTIPVVESKTLLDNWKKFHDNPSPGEPVFTSFQGGNRISYNCARRQLRRISDRADIEKKVNPHAFRKSRATWMASKGANIFQLMEFFGWSTSETAMVYVRMAQSDVEDLVFRLSRQSDLTEFESDRVTDNPSRREPNKAVFNTL
jgi:integrase